VRLLDPSFPKTHPPCGPKFLKQLPLDAESTMPSTASMISKNGCRCPAGPPLKSLVKAATSQSGLANRHLPGGGQYTP